MTVVTVTAVARTRAWNPNVGPWLKAQRGTRKQDAVIADLAKRGVVIGRSWLSRAENGAPMSEELLRAFEDYYGSVAPPYEPSVAGPGSDATLPGLAALIVAALDRQTTALEEISAKLERALLVPSPEAAELVADYFRSAPTPSERPRRGRPARPGTQ